MATNKPIDWELCVKLANGDKQLARKLLEAYIIALKKLQKTLQETRLNSQQLQQEVHRLCGASCYSGVPKLKESAYRLQVALNNNATKATARLFSELLRNIELVLQFYDKNNYS